MARLNIEDSLFKDSRFLDLVVKTGNYSQALGDVVLAWVVAQEYFLKNNGFIPLDVWQKRKLNDALIECGLAIKQESGVYLAGTHDQFAWIKQRSNAGRKGAKIINASGSSTDDSRRSPDDSRRSPDDSRRSPDDSRRSTDDHPTTPDERNSASSSYSYSSSNTKNNTHTADSSKSDADALWVCVKLWNEKSGEKLAKVSEIKLAGSTKRLLKLIQLRKENPLNEEEFSLAVDFISKEKFYTGDSKSGWKANFDWLLEPENSTKILDEATNKSSQKFKPPSEQEIYYE